MRTQQDLTNLVTELEKFGSLKEFVKRVNISLINYSRKKLEVYSMESTDQTKEIIVESIYSYISKPNFLNKNITNYDPIITKNLNHITVDVNKFSNIVNVVEYLRDKDSHLITLENLKEMKFDLYMVSMDIAENNYMFFGQFSNILSLNKRLIFGNFDDKKLKFRGNDEIFGFNRKIDLILKNSDSILVDAALVKFERLFSMDSYYIAMADDILQTNMDLMSILDQSTLDLLTSKSLSGKRFSRRIMKMISDEGRLKDTVRNISNVEKIKADVHHKFYDSFQGINFKDGKLNIEEGQEENLVRIITDVYYSALISETYNIDESLT